MGLRAVIIRCPNCNASLEIVSTVSSVTCAYCGVVSRIQAKTMMFQVPKSLPPVQAQSPQQRMEQLQQLQQLRPVRRASIAMLMIPILVVVTVVASSLFWMVRKGVGFSSDKILWGGRPPVLLDVDGDGTLDLIGIVRYIMDDDRSHLAAYSGKTGAKLWQSESLGTYISLGQHKFGRLGALVLMASDRGNLIARDGATGSVKWQLSFNEKIDLLCEAGPGAVVVGTADNKWSRVDEQGVRHPSEKLVRLDRGYSNDGARAQFDHAGVEQQGVCIPITGPYFAPGGVVALPRWGVLAKVEGMNVELLIRRPGSSDTIGFGSKTPGTAVPMVARIDGENATWTAEIPASDPLVAHFDDEDLAISDKAVFALYTIPGTSGARITAFEIATGRRLWDREIATGTGFVVAGMVVAGDLVLLSTWQDLRAYAAADGSEKFSIGSRH